MHHMDVDKAGRELRRNAMSYIEQTRSNIPQNNSYTATYLPS